MFLENKYTRCYNTLVERTQVRTVVDGYSEVHHKIPKSLGGSNSKTNLVRLTAREHFICHLLLVKMVEGVALQKMQWALFMMIRGNKKQAQRYVPTSRLFETARVAGAASASARQKGKPKSDASKEKMKLAWIARRERKAAGLESRKPMSEQARQNIAAGKLGKPGSESQKLKNSIAHKKLWQVPEHRQKVLRAQEAARSKY